MLDKLAFFLAIMVLGLGTGLFYSDPNPITFGCMMVDIYLAIFVLVIEAVDRIDRRK